MATFDRDGPEGGELRNQPGTNYRVDVDEEDVEADEVGAGGAAEAGASAALGANVSAQTAGGLGAAAVGSMAARELVEDETGRPEADAARGDSPDQYAGGGSTSGGQDLPRRERD
jgi:hypothetical protein